MTEYSFQRYELKYMISPDDLAILLHRFSSTMKPDPFCREGAYYTIYNIYFDTETDEVIRKSLEKPYYKEKLRLRSYAIPRPEDPVFLELKKKIDGRVSKRRAMLPYQQALELLKSPEPKKYDTKNRQILCEIRNHLQRYELSPRVFIRYDRLAFFGKDDPDFRVSFDQNILARRTDLALDKGDFGEPLLEERQVLMEIKCKSAIPFPFSRLLSELQLCRTGFSKYGTEYLKQREQDRLSRVPVRSTEPGNAPNDAEQRLWAHAWT